MFQVLIIRTQPHIKGFMAENLLGGLVFDLSRLRLGKLSGTRALERYSGFLGLPHGVQELGWEPHPPPKKR